MKNNRDRIEQAELRAITTLNLVDAFISLHIDKSISAEFHRYCQSNLNISLDNNPFRASFTSSENTNNSESQEKSSYNSQTITNLSSNIRYNNNKNNISIPQLSANNSPNKHV